MSFIDRMLGGSASSLPPSWKVLEKEDQLQQLLKDSHQKPVVIFKHSVSCGISAMAKYGLESRWDFAEGDLDFYYLDLINFRPVSNLIARDLNVIHQSPQIIMLKNGEVVYNTSHHRISIDGIRKALQ